MIFFYLMIGTLLVLALVMVLRWYARAEVSVAKNALRILLLIATVILVLFLLRFGQGWLAALFAVLGVLATVAQRLLMLLPFYNVWQRHRQSRQHSQSGSSGDGPMTREQALEILGLKEGASRDEIIEAHRRLMKKNHPDQGGSDYLARTLNQAKDILLKGR